MVHLSIQGEKHMSSITPILTTHPFTTLEFSPNVDKPLDLVKGRLYAQTLDQETPLFQEVQHVLSTGYGICTLSNGVKLHLFPGELKGGAGIDANRLLNEKLENSGKSLSSEESIALLMECMNRGEVAAQKGQGQELVVFIGNTGAGKSTLVNYLYGCDMEVIDCEQTLEGRAIAVKPRSKGGKYDPVMEIGHTKKSKTFMPQIEKGPTQDMIYCDCPGFLENRGFEINIANAVNIRKALTQAKSIKVLMLINYHSLRADRARGLREMIKIACDLFGSKENLVKYKDSLLLGVTQIDRGVDEPIPLNRLKNWVADPDGITDEFSQNAIRYLSERLFVYDPLDRALRYESVKRDELFDKVKRLTPITDTKHIFKTALSNDDQNGLIQISENIGRAIETSLISQDFRKASEYMKGLEKLQVIDHQYVTDSIVRKQHLIINHFKDMSSKFDLLAGNAANELPPEAEQIFKRFKDGIVVFEDNIRSQVNIAGFENRYAFYKKKFEARQKVETITGVEQAFERDVTSEQFDNARQKISELKTKQEEFAKKYGDTGVTLSLNIGQLENRLNQGIKIRDDRVAAEARVRQAEAAAAQARSDAAAAQARADSIAAQARAEADARARKIQQNQQLISDLQTLKGKCPNNMKPQVQKAINQAKNDPNFTKYSSSYNGSSHALRVEKTDGSASLYWAGGKKWEDKARKK